MELIEQVKVLYTDFGTKDIAKMLRVRQTTIKKIVDDNNFKLIKKRRINIEDFYNIQKKEISYLLGLIWADGHLSKRDNTLSIECVSEDMIFFKETLDKVGRWSYHYRDRERYGIKCKSLTNAYICDSLLHKFLEENDYLEIVSIISEATHKISDFHNLSIHKITLEEINEILVILIKYKTYITSKWFNYYKYYFNSIYSIILVLCEVQDLPFTFAHLVSIINNDIYESLDLITNLSNNDFKKKAKELMYNITLFLK